MERQAITVRGVVQGVGFRPFVYALARRLGLHGFVKNRTGSVLIEVEGDRETLGQFFEELQSRPPPLSRIDNLQRRSLPLLDEVGFRIEPSDSDSASPIFISPDVSTCSDCLAEMFDPSDRRFRYPFLNCTNCGPRLTIIRGAPYDRERTTMAGFPMCPACRSEYEDPVNRRFHAQPTACPDCGPRLESLKANGQPIATDDPLAVFVNALLCGRIGALKGLGGFHLVCDARNDRAVSELRRRKHRDEKPFAVMVRDIESARDLCRVESRECKLLESRRRPIVLLRKRQRSSKVPACQSGGKPSLTNKSRPGSATTGVICEAVAPGNPFLGVMLPYTPLHHLLMESVGGIPLVMTSGNRSDEPIAYLDDEAVTRLGEIADVFLTHNRPIRVRCDDSVTRIVAGEELPLRRSRGYAPEPVKLPLRCPIPMLAVGGQFKGVFALGRERQAFLSHHMGDLDHFDAYQAFERDIQLYEEVFHIRPELIVHDLHPDYASTGYAQRAAKKAEAKTESGSLCRNGPSSASQKLMRVNRRVGNAHPTFSTVAVQHHHAHMASCMAEHGLDETVIGVMFDGTGYGTDKAIWGGEFLVGDYSQFSRAAHLRYVQMPGGDKAIRQPWRMAVSHLLDADCDLASFGDVSASQRRTVGQMIARRFNSPLTSSAGRLFDALAALAGVRSQVSYEGQAAIELEWLATEIAEDGAYPFEVTELEEESKPNEQAGESGGAVEKHLALSRPPWVIDTRPLIRAVIEDLRCNTAAERIARRFHSTVVQMIATVCGQIRSQTGLRAVVLSGGVFMNALLTREVSARLEEDGFRVYRHRLVPPNDGGLCLGQVAIAARTVGHAACISRFEQSSTQAASTS